MKIRKPEMKKARIEIIPMIDAIFFLLVFFMFSSLSMIRMRGANVSLPAGQNGKSTAGTGETPKLIVSVTNSGAYFLNKKSISRQTLQKSLQDEVSARSNAVVVVNMAKNQTTQTLVDVLDSINKVRTPSGAPAPVLIATEPVDNEGRAIEAKAR
ncbi:biopolymer transporter ExbD [bacterium]|nr:MAG: biopolymer transporter ExbD [bacterium]